MRKPDWQQDIAEERIEILFSLAEKEFKKHPDRAERYIELARKIGLRYNVRLPKDLKRKFCKKCMNYLKPGVNTRIRLNKGKKTYFCMDCGKIVRVPYK